MRWKLQNLSPPPSEDFGLLTVPEAARLLRISRNLTYELIAQHQLPSIRFGCVIRVPRRALETWICQRIDDARGAQR